MQPVQAGAELAGDAIRIEPVIGPGLHRVILQSRSDIPVFLCNLCPIVHQANNALAHTLAYGAIAIFWIFYWTLLFRLLGLVPGPAIRRHRTQRVRQPVQSR